MIKISIVVPVYNTEKYLKRCLESISKQSLKEIEIIIVNDGSPDNSHSIIKEYEEKDSRIKVINKKNGGISSARNEGIKLASGKYIIHIDSDDFIEQNYFKDMYEKAEKDNLDIVVSDIYWDYENGNIKYQKDLDINENIISGEEYVNMFFKEKISPVVWNKMYRLNLYKDNNIKYPENVSLGEDLATTPLLAKNAKRIGKINKAYLHYVQNINSITKSNPTKKIYELIEALNILEKYFPNISKIKVDTIKIGNLGTLIFNSNYDLNDKFYEEGLKNYVDIFKNKHDYDNYGKKLKIYFKLLSIFPSIKTLKLICYFNRVGIGTKKVVKQR